MTVMTLVPSDFPNRIAAEGLQVTVFNDWYGLGGSADHKAVVLHHTASSAGTSGDADAAYCHHGSSDSPLYNVLVSRDGHVYVLAREKSNSSGKINSTALNEAKNGQAQLVTAASRGLPDNTSANDALFAICAQNDGVGEHWSDALVSAMSITSAVALECLGLSHAGYVTEHRCLTQRKIDPCGPGCPT